MKFFNIILLSAAAVSAIPTGIVGNTEVIKRDDAIKMGSRAGVYVDAVKPTLSIDGYIKKLLPQAAKFEESLPDKDSPGEVAEAMAVIMYKVLAGQKEAFATLTEDVIKLVGAGPVVEKLGDSSFIEGVANVLAKAMGHV
ncbi:hypothetical protein H072_194 [Dactylellina haptotyla CBS 200.50]|uniref:Uncharacterized protein n=1 Tax=Dactylellina haptotyla (strain CBS 200.50) TaxID=1284197 RepID=S8C2E4_DACHA|nr:hypothetical protein H072_194 [Dactylellina haptotyla CBS 200.50]